MREVSEFEFPPLQSKFRCKWATDKQEHVYQGHHPELVSYPIKIYNAQFAQLSSLVTRLFALITPYVLRSGEKKNVAGWDK